MNIQAFKDKLENYVALAARLSVKAEASEAVEVLTYGEASVIDNYSWDFMKSVEEQQRDPNLKEIDIGIKIPEKLFLRLETENKLDMLEHNVAVSIRSATRHVKVDEKTLYIEKVQIIAITETNHLWREQAKTWLSGEGVSNQGRVRSNNIASLEEDGLLFRSEPEIYLYRALKSLGIPFAPLPVFVRGGQEYRRIEPDFIIIKEGLVMHVEVDGDTTHEEAPVEAHDRTTMLAHEGVKVERVRAGDCNTPTSAMT